MMIIGISKLYQANKTTIPKKVRTRLGISDGDEVSYFLENDITEIRDLLTKYGDLVILIPNTNNKKKNRFHHI